MATSAGVFQAVEDCKQWRLQYFLNNGIRISGRNKRGENVLLTALRIPDARGRQRMFHWLLTLGVSPQNVDKVHERSVLQWAAFLDRPAELRTLLVEKEGELDLEGRDASGLTALHYGVVNDSVMVVTMLTRQMRKYGLSVDIPDFDGLTPYLLAVRLGCRECARVLRREGGASHFRFDTSFRTTADWEELGRTERGRRERQEQNRQVGVYKTFGRLPQLMAASYDTARIKIALLSKNERAALFDFSQSRFGANNTLQSQKADGVTCSLPSLTPAREHSFTSVTSSAESAPPSEYPMQAFARELQAPQTPPSPLRDDGKSFRRSLPQLMGLASERCTESYRATAVRPPGYVDPAKDSSGSISFGTAAKVSTFAVKLKKKALSKNGSSRSSRTGDRPSKRPSVAGQDKCPLLV